MQTIFINIFIIIMNPYNNPYVTKLTFRMTEDTGTTMGVMVKDNHMVIKDTMEDTMEDTINHTAEGKTIITMGKEAMDIIIKIRGEQMIAVPVWLLLVVPAAFSVAVSDDCGRFNCINNL